MRLSTIAPLAFVLLQGPTAGAQSSSEPSDAVVFIRVFGTISAEVDEFRKRVEKSDVQIATGTGFIVSPSGYILTNHHLINPENKTITFDGRRFEIKTAVDRIEVVLHSGQRFDATVFGSDADMDLAALAAGVGGLPYLPLGDSDAIKAGESVSAFGYPLGESVEIGRKEADSVPPQATVTPGAVSAVRAGDDDAPRFLQVSNALNPGNSGGPIVDANGYAVGIVAMRATKAAGIGFAIAINRAKDFLERIGLDSALPSRRLSLAGPSSLLEKGLRLRMPHGYQDVLPGRLRVEAGDDAAGEPFLRITRVASRSTADHLERELLGGRLIAGGSFELDGDARRLANRQVSGRARKTDADGMRRTMAYRIFPTGGEWIVACYVASSDAEAFNRNLLRASLDSVEAEPLLRGEIRPPRWRSGNPLPDGWIRETDEGAIVTVTSPENFAFSATYMVSAFDATALMKRLEVPPNGSYKRLWSIAGEGTVCLGQILPVAGGSLQIELIGPREREASLAQWLREWRAALEAK